MSATRIPSRIPSRLSTRSASPTRSRRSSLEYAGATTVATGRSGKGKRSASSAPAHSRDTAIAHPQVSIATARRRIRGVSRRRSLGPAWARQSAHERHHSGQCFVTLDCECGVLELPDDDVGGESELAVHALVEVPAVRPTHPDEVVNLHTSGLVLQAAGHDQIIGAVERNEAIETM